MISGHSTYAEVPLFNWLQDTLISAATTTIRSVIFAQGFVPHIIVREILIRKSPIKHGKWLPFMVICVSLSLSAPYELSRNNWISQTTGTATEAFLGTQGYVWDTQSDNFMALLGAITTSGLLSRVHNRALSLDYK